MPSINSGRHRQYRKRSFPFQGLFFILLLLFGIYSLLNSSFFALEKVTVSGNSQLDKAEIVKLSAISPGINIFKLKTGEIEKKILLHPRVKNVEVKRVLPREVQINMVERTGKGLLPKEGSFAVIDVEAVFLYEVGSIEKMNLPIITGVNAGNFKIGEPIISEGLKDALFYLKVMSPEISAIVSEINVADSENIRMYTIDGVEVKLGNTDKAREKLSIYADVISQKYEEKIQYIDLSYYSKPVVKFLTKEK